MAIHDLSTWQHDHVFDAGNRTGERRTWIVVAITAACMVAEIVAGWLTGSMALLADGWHMATHVVALSIAGLAYQMARRWATDERFAFGTWKIEILGAFTSALLLGIVALAMVWESVERLLTPQEIKFGPALLVAVIGLLVNLASALVLGDGHDHGNDHGHDHDHDHDHDHGHGHEQHEHDHGKGPAHHDLNLRSAYVHVLADAVTSVFAIVALGAGLWLGWNWLDPAMGLVGSGVIASWVWGLLTQSSRVLVDREMDSPVVAQIRSAIQTDGDSEIADLHVWRVGRASYAAVIMVVAHHPLAPADYRQRVAAIPGLTHISIEVNRCPHGDCP